MARSKYPKYAIAYLNNFRRHRLEYYFYPDDFRKYPIPKLSMEKQKLFVYFVDIIIFLKNHYYSDTEISDFFEYLIDGMVYDLYFRELLKQNNCEIIKYLSNLTEITEGMSDEQKFNSIKDLFNQLNKKEHPVTVNLFNLNSIPEIAKIEGNKEDN